MVASLGSGVDRRAEPARSLSHAIKDGCAHAVMCGLGEAYLSAFGVFLAMSSLALGVLASLPLLVGSLAQVLSVWLLDRAPRRKPIVVWFAGAQGLCWLPMFLLPLLLPAYGTALLLAAAVAYFALGAFAGPAWNSWIGDLVLPEERGKYFGRREQLRMMCQLGGLLLAGWTLYWARQRGHEALGFAGVFSAALLARMASTWHLGRQYEPGYASPRAEDLFSFWDFLQRSPHSNFGRFSFYVAGMMAAVHVSAPFFVLYMLRDLKFSYLQLSIVSAVILLAQAMTFRVWGRLGDRYGHLNLLKVTGLLMFVCPIQWLLSPRFEAILVFQAISGVVWAGFNLSAFNFLFDSVSPPKRARCVAYYSVLVNVGIFLGALAGGWLAPYLPGELVILGWRYPLASSLQVLFFISGLLRLLVSMVFLPYLREVREVERPEFPPVITRVAGLFAVRGMRFSVFDGVHPRERGPDHTPSP